MPLFDTYEKLIDYWNTVEHLSATGEALFGKDSPVEELWYDMYRWKILEEDRGPGRINRSIEYYAKKLSSARKNVSHLLSAQQALNTLCGVSAERTSHRQRPVEAACKTLVNTRMCLSGMRWTRQGGEHLLDMRTYMNSDRRDSARAQTKKLSIAA